MLIDEHKGEWKVDVKKEVFNEGEAGLICGLPVSKTGSSDKQIWAPSMSGVFNVKYAYHFKMQRRILEESSNASFEKEGWSDIWRLKILGVIKMFLHKVLNNCLPTRRKLFKRKVLDKPCCPVCNQYEETICHVLWNCAGVDGSSPVHKWSSEKVDFRLV